MSDRATPVSPDDLRQRVERILAAGQVSRQEYFQLMSLFLSDFAVTREDRYQLNRVFDELQMNRLQFTALEADKAEAD